MKYYSKEGVTPGLLTKVFLTGTGNDLDRHRVQVTDHLVRAMDCAVFYEEDPERPEDADYLNDISGMQLVVVLVSEEFFHTECSARLRVLEHARAQNIPLLPVKVGQISWAEYAEVFGKAEALNIASADDTRLSFDARLEQFKDAVLINDEEVAAIRGAFRGKIFLSYRKKDRKSALELMRVIHGRAENLDLSVWYDEYLIPGENYDATILETLSDSDLFLLNVTPSLLEPDNYVVKKEYPDAVARGKKILAVESVPVADRKALTAAFAGLDECIAIGDERAIYAKLAQAIPPRGTPSDRTPDEECLLGLAYLNGLFVRQDKKTGAALIMEAEARGSLRALSKLRSMYEFGNGVPRSYEAAIDCQKRMAEYYGSHPEEPLAELQAAVHTYYLAMDMNRFGRPELAVEQFKKLNGLCEELSKKQIARDQVLHMLRNSYEQLSVINEAMGHPDAAAFYREYAATLNNAHDPDDAARRLLNDARVLTAEGDASCHEGKAEDARARFEKAREIVAGLLQDPAGLGWDYPDAVRLSYVIEGKNALLMEGPQAIGILEKCAEQATRMHGENPERREYLNDYVIFCRQIADCYYEMKDFNSSYEYLRKGVAAQKSRLETSDLPQDKELLFQLYAQKCQCALSFDNKLPLIDSISEANTLRAQMTGFALSPDTILDMALVDRCNALFLAEQDCFDEAVKMLDSATDSLRKTLGTMNMEPSARLPFYSTLGDLFLDIATFLDRKVDGVMKQHDPQAEPDAVAMANYYRGTDIMSAVDAAQYWLCEYEKITGNMSEIRGRFAPFSDRILNEVLDWMIGVMTRCGGGVPPELRFSVKTISQLAPELRKIIDLDVLKQLQEDAETMLNGDV